MYKNKQTKGSEPILQFITTATSANQKAATLTPTSKLL